MAFRFRVRHLNGLKAAARKARRPIPAARQLRLQATHHDCLELPAVGFNAAGKALAIEQFEQRGKTFLVPVMGCGGEKELVLEVRRQQANDIGT